MSDSALVVTLGRRDADQRLLADSLRDQGYSVDVADSQGAVSSSLSESPPPDLAILDIDGYDPSIWEVSEQCAAGSTAVLLLASADAGRVRAEASQHGIDAVLSKPLDRSTLSSTIGRLLGAAGNELEVAADEARVRLLMADGENRRLLASWLADRYTVEQPAGTSLEGTFDLVVLDEETLVGMDGERLRERKTEESPVHLPFLLVGGSEEVRQNRDVWTYLDDIITTPIEQNVLSARLESQFEVRRLSVALQQRNRRLDRFASVVSHDLRNPIDVAKLRVDLADRECDTEHLDPVVEALDRMEAILEDVLTLARDGTDVEDPEPADVSTVAQQAWETVDTPDATLECGPDLPTVRADAGRLRQLFENLYRNSIEHGGASVTVSVEALDDGFAVADDGSGIPAEDRLDVFDSGYTTSEGGTGFGLDIVKTICSAHDWTVSVTESPAGGAQFEVTDVTVPG